MSEEDYFHDRAEAQLKLAESAEHPRVARAHYLLAGYYLDRCYGGAEQGKPDNPAFFARDGNAVMELRLKDKDR